jgi:hypothetical protein
MLAVVVVGVILQQALVALVAVEVALVAEEVEAQEQEV